MSVDKINLAKRGIIVNPYDTKLLAALIKTEANARVPLLPRLCDDDRAIAIIRMRDNKGLFCTGELGKLERINPNDFVGDNAMRFNIPEVFHRYINDLLHHRFLDGYTMPVLDGLGNKKIQTVRVWLADWNGEDVRVVQVLEERF